MSIFVHAQGKKTVHAGGGGQKYQNSVHVVVECPLTSNSIKNQIKTYRPGNFTSSVKMHEYTLI